MVLPHHSFHPNLRGTQQNIVIHEGGTAKGGVERTPVGAAGRGQQSGSTEGPQDRLAGREIYAVRKVFWVNGRGGGLSPRLVALLQLSAARVQGFELTEAQDLSKCRSPGGRPRFCAQRASHLLKIHATSR